MGQNNLLESLRRRSSSGLLAAAALGALTACGDSLNKQEKQLVGNYFITAVSDTHPLLELRADRTATVRAIRPGELSFCVSGRWRIEADSLIIDNEASSITIEDGDPSLVGNVAERLAYPLIFFDDNILRIEKHGIVYDYHRRSN